MRPGIPNPTGPKVSFSAKYFGYCSNEDCTYGDDRISPGDEVSYVEDELMHESCASRARHGEPPLMQRLLSASPRGVPVTCKGFRYA
jgi:hypothetical protein